MHHHACGRTKRNHACRLKYYKLHQLDRAAIRFFYLILIEQRTECVCWEYLTYYAVVQNAWKLQHIRSVLLLYVLSYYGLT